jgi:hypothetical protein
VKPPEPFRSRIAQANKARIRQCRMWYQRARRLRVLRGVMAQVRLNDGSDWMPTRLLPEIERFGRDDTLLDTPAEHRRRWLDRQVDHQIDAMRYMLEGVRAAGWAT